MVWNFVGYIQTTRGWCWCWCYVGMTSNGMTWYDIWWIDVWWYDLLWCDVRWRSRFFSINCCLFKVTLSRTSCHFPTWDLRNPTSVLVLYQDVTYHLRSWIWTMNVLNMKGAFWLKSFCCSDLGPLTWSFPSPQRVFVFTTVRSLGLGPLCKHGAVDGTSSVCGSLCFYLK